MCEGRGRWRELGVTWSTSTDVEGGDGYEGRAGDCNAAPNDARPLRHRGVRGCLAHAGRWKALGRPLWQSQARAEHPRMVSPTCRQGLFAAALEAPVLLREHLAIRQEHFSMYRERLGHSCIRVSHSKLSTSLSYHVYSPCGLLTILLALLRPAPKQHALIQLLLPARLSFLRSPPSCTLCITYTHRATTHKNAHIAIYPQYLSSVYIT